MACNFCLNLLFEEAPMCPLSLSLKHSSTCLTIPSTNEIKLTFHSLLCIEVLIWWGITKSPYILCPIFANFSYLNLFIISLVKTGNLEVNIITPNFQIKINILWLIYAKKKWLTEAFWCFHLKTDSNKIQNIPAN